VARTATAAVLSARKPLHYAGGSLKVTTANLRPGTSSSFGMACSDYSQIVGDTSPIGLRQTRFLARCQSGRSQPSGCAACSRGTAPSFGLKRDLVETGSDPVRLRLNDTALRKSAVYAACGIMQRILSRAPKTPRVSNIVRDQSAPRLKFRCTKPLETISSYVF
jgi:hypothetical protein